MIARAKELPPPIKGMDSRNPLNLIPLPVRAERGSAATRGGVRGGVGQSEVTK